MKRGLSCRELMSERSSVKDLSIIMCHPENLIKQILAFLKLGTSIAK